MRSLVTGGAGFIGSHLAAALAARGDDVLVFDNLSTGSRDNLAGIDARLIVGDIRDGEALEQTMQGVERVFHLAAMISVPVSMEQPQECYAINLQGSLNVLESARRAGVGRVVLSSSAAVYGGLEGEVSEDSPLHPVSPYAASKLAMEQAAALYAEVYALPTVALRYFNVYGPGQSPDSPYAAAIPKFIQRMLAGEAPLIFGDGKQTRDFVYVEDVVAANLLASEAEDVAGAVFNIAGGTSRPLLELLDELQTLLPAARAPEFGLERPGDVRFSAANLRKAEQALGYRTQYALRRGLEDTIQWFREGRQ